MFILIKTGHTKQTLLDPEQVGDADAEESQKKTLKALAFPLMDEPDALPSSYITRVLQAVAKWSCKMVALSDDIAAIGEPNANMKAILFSIHERKKKSAFQTLSVLSFLNQNHSLVGCGLGYLNVPWRLIKLLGR